MLLLPACHRCYCLPSLPVLLLLLLLLLLPLLATLQVCMCTVRAEDVYNTILDYSYSFFEAQMSGTMPSWNRWLYTASSGWKKSSVTTEGLGTSVNTDLSGGFYDAGGHSNSVSSSAGHSVS